MTSEKEAGWGTEYEEGFWTPRRDAVSSYVCLAMWCPPA